MSDSVLLSVAGGVGHIQLNRPQQANSLDMGLSRALLRAVRAVADDEGVRSVLVSGAGKRFCAGGDISSFLAAEDRPAYLYELAHAANDAVQAIAGLVKPVVTVVQGSVAGAGLGLMLAGDLIIAEPGTRFVFAYPAVGLTPDCGTGAALVRSMGQHRALEFALGGQPLEADRARELGLVTEVCEDAHDRGRRLARQLAEGPALALGRTRALLRDTHSLTAEQLAESEARSISASVTGPEAERLLELFAAR